MTFFEAALAVLKRSRKALTTDEIVAAAQTRGLLETRGKTPIASMSAVLYRELDKPKPAVRRIFEAGPSRARRRTVRWQLISEGTNEQIAE